MTVFRIPLAAGLSLTLATLAAPCVQAAEPDGPERIISRTDAVYISVLDRLSEKGRKGLRLDDGDREGLTEYYMDRDNALVWVGDEGLNDRVKQLRKTFARAGKWGLNSSDYSPADGKGFSSHSGYPAAWLAEAELKTSIAAITYARQAQTGRLIPTSISANLDKHPARPDPAAVLKGLPTAGEGIPAYLEAFNPQHEQFKALKKLLANGGVSGGAADGDEDEGARLPDGPSLGPGTSHPHIAILRDLLSVRPMRQAPGDGPAAEYYDERLARAVKRFQKRHRLSARGVVDAETREALNKAAASESRRSRRKDDGKIDRATILANMERWRWEARNLGDRHVRVSIPAFMFYVVEDSRVVHSERIVSGSKEHPTPIFSDEIETIVFNPYWHVPVSILTKEILPAIRRDPSFLDRNRLEVVWRGRKPVVDSFWGGFGVDWEGVDARQISLRQTPGAGNALGVVKFAFPNKHSVYMHDTPTKHLFEKKVRAYSHGCMRVRHPLKFAEVLLSKQGWTKRRVDATLDNAHDEHVRLQSKVPIHIQYFTLWVNPDGSVRRYGDIYGYDARVKGALKLARNVRTDGDGDRLDAGEHGMGN